MPWGLRQSGNKWQVYKKTDGKVKGVHTSKQSAMRQLWLLQGIEHGWKPTKK